MTDRHHLAPDSVGERGFARLSRRRLLRGSSTAVAATALAAPALVSRELLSVAAGAAQEGTPVATLGPGEEAFSPEVIARIVQFVHPHKVFGYLPGFEDKGLPAAIYGLDVDAYRELTDRFAAAARGAAEELLADQDFAAQVDRLPFAPEATVIGVGESDMDDLQSWLEILRHLIELRRPKDGIAVINQGISGQATGEALGRFVGILNRQPSWIICALGGNDAVRYGRQPTKTRVSIDETAKNLTELRHLAATQSKADWVWVTRWSIDEARIAAYPQFQQAQFTLRSEDMAAVNEIVQRQPGLVVDLVPVIGQPPTSELLGEDGLHPSLAGHQAIARALVERLAEPAQS